MRHNTSTYAFCIETILNADEELECIKDQRKNPTKYQKKISDDTPMGTRNRFIEYVRVVFCASQYAVLSK